ncbi:MAG: type IV pilus assembly protein PilM [bacterium]|nr:type IV pilus assembly protein PilM [bacterium]
MAARIFGLDIGSTTLKVVQLSKSGKGIRLEAVGSCPAPPRGLTSESRPDQEAMASSIKKLVQDAGISSKRVNTALPESQIYTQVREIAPLSDNELAAAIPWEAEQSIPLPVADVSIDFQVLERPAKQTPDAKMSILLVAAPKVVINKYLTILELAGLEVASLETEVIAICRALNLIKEFATIPTLVINLGSLTTDITVVKGGIINFTRSITTGGKALARAVAEKLGLEERVAEEYKMAYGLNEQQLEGKVLEAIKPIFDVVIGEIKRATTFYAERHPDTPLRRAVVVGGTAKLPGIMLYLAQSLGLEVQLGDVWQAIEKDQRFASTLESDGAIFTTVLGLALKGVV